MRTAAALALALAHATTAGAAGRLGDPLCSVRREACGTGPLVAVFTAFPAETRPFLAAMRVTETLTVGGRRFDVGSAGAARVVVVRTGIGMVHAAEAARAAVARFRPAAMVVSGVAGSHLNIGDVAVPAAWVARDTGASHPSDPHLLALAEEVAAAPPALTQCALVPPTPPNATVCLPGPPRLVVGGTGASGDPYGGTALACLPNHDPVLGCDPEPLAARADAPPAVEDMETAAVAAVAHEAGIPFVAFRGVSDGRGDPLGLPGFPAQFFAWYEVAADNAAAAVLAFLDRWAAAAATPAASRPADGDATPPDGDATPAGVGAACAWHRGVSSRCAADEPSARLTRAVAAACRLLARLPDATPARAARLARRARARWRRAARLARRPRHGLAGDCRADVARALRLRGARDG